MKNWKSLILNGLFLVIILVGAVFAYSELTKNYTPAAMLVGRTETGADTVQTDFADTDRGITEQFCADGIFNGSYADCNITVSGGCDEFTASAAAENEFEDDFDNKHQKHNSKYDTNPCGITFVEVILSYRFEQTASPVKKFTTFHNFTSFGCFA